MILLESWSCQKLNKAMLSTWTTEEPQEKLTHLVKKCRVLKQNHRVLILDSSSSSGIYSMVMGLGGSRFSKLFQETNCIDLIIWLDSMSSLEESVISNVPQVYYSHMVLILMTPCQWLLWGGTMESLVGWKMSKHWRHRINDNSLQTSF